MRIAVMAYSLRVAGGMTVGKNIIAALGKVADEHDYLLLMPAGLGYEQIDKPSRSTCHYYRRNMGAVGQLLYEKLKVPRLVRRFKPSLVWGLGNFGLTDPGAPQAMLFHDAHLVCDPRRQAKPLWKLRFGKKLALRRLARCLPWVQLVFCQTRTAADHFRRRFQNVSRMAIMAPAVSRFVVRGDASARPEIFETLEGRFVLFCLTRYYEHKNLEVLAETFRRHADSLAGVVVLLTIAADQHPKARRLLEEMETEPLKGRLINVGPLQQHELASYFTASDGFILPTVLETFGLPYVEAMRFGCPILTSDLDFAREVCGPAAIYFDPYDPASVRDAVLKLKGGADRQALIDAGREQFRRYDRDWETIVREALAELTALAPSPRT